MKKRVKFLNGNEYSIKELFGLDTKIIVPDIQRDYCWGDYAIVSLKDRRPRELVTGFVKNLVEIYMEMIEQQDSNSITLGLIYGYEQPYNHLQICDGQQRLTTIFLLLGCLNIRTNGSLDNYLISENEMNDDYEPHLQYAIRESTLYFLSDLARWVFVERKTDIKDIKKSNWYFSEYDLDASIQSMISAINSIEEVLDSNHINYEHFSEFVLERLCVLYYDMEERSRGEETYVVINTTGEPLSTTENIKPILLGDTKLSKDQRAFFSDQWEKREDWFWQNRGIDLTADNGMQEFFMWYWQIGLNQESSWIGDKKQPLNIRDLFVNKPKRISETGNEPTLNMDDYNKFKSLENLHKYFEALKNLVEDIKNDDNLQKVLLSSNTKKRNVDTVILNNTSNVWNWLRSIDLDIILPLLCLKAEHQDSRILYPFARRLRKNHYDSVWSKTPNSEQSRRGKNYIDWRYLIQIIKNTDDDVLLTTHINDVPITRIPQVNLNEWYTDDEKKKAKMKEKKMPVDDMENNNVLMGDLTPLWRSCRLGEVDDDTIMKRWDILQKMCASLNCKTAIRDIQFANWFRLYRLVSGLINFEHISNCTWDFEGCYYSRMQSMPWWVESEFVENLYESENPVHFMKTLVAKYVSSFINKPTNYKELIISWLTIKTFIAEKNDLLLNFRDDRAISAFKDLERNYIVPCNEFHWGNVLCGYSYSYYVFPARDITEWNKQSNLDSPLHSLSFISPYYEREKDVIDINTIVEGDKDINALIDEFTTKYSIQAKQI